MVRLLKTVCHLSTRHCQFSTAQSQRLYSSQRERVKRRGWKSLESRFGVGEGRLEDGLGYFAREGTFGATGIIRGDREEIGGTGFETCHGVTGDIHGQRGKRRTIPARGRCQIDPVSLKVRFAIGIPR